MKSRINRAQFEKLADILGAFGVADKSGLVIFSNCAVEENSIVKIPENEEETDSPGDLYYEDSRFGYLRYIINEEESLLFFTALAGEMTKTLLRLAVCAYDNRIDFERRKTVEFLHGLMAGNQDVLNMSDTAVYYNFSESSSFYVITVVFDGAAGADDPAIISEFLSGMFPQRNGNYVVPMDIGRLAIVCPARTEEEKAQIKETAGLIKDTVFSELMIDVNVGIGIPVDSLKGLQTAYKTAERAEQEGKIFELQDKCFVYDSLGLYRLIYGQNSESCIMFLREVFGREFLKERYEKVKSGAKDELLTSLTVFLENNQNISETAKALFVHRNTLIYRIGNLNKITGRDCTKYSDGMLMGIGILVFKYFLKVFPEKAEAEFS